MGNCLIILGLRKLKRPVTLLLVGLDDAGKTTAAKGIVGDPVTEVAPTIGFSPEKLEYRGCAVTIYDLGGNKRIRDVWTKYFSEVHGIIYVIDSSAERRFEESKEELINLLSHKKIAGKPVLILANKQDVEGAKDEIDILDNLNIEHYVTKYKCPTRVETCSAITIKNQKPDKPIADGFRWLIDTIILDYEKLNKRVTKDLEVEMEKWRMEKEVIRERIRKVHEEQKRIELIKNGHVCSEDSSSDGDVQILYSEADVNNYPRLNEDDEVVCLENESPDSPRSESSDIRVLQALGISNSGHNSPDYNTLPPLLSKNNSMEQVENSQNFVYVKPAEMSAKNSNDKSKLSSGENVSLDSSLSTEQENKSFNNDDSIVKGSDELLYLDLNLENDLKECIAIDSDDDIFNFTSPSCDEANKVNFVSFMSTSVHPVASEAEIKSSSSSCIKGHLDAETTHKKRSFLKRYHKTAPFVPFSLTSPALTES